MNFDYDNYISERIGWVQDALDTYTPSVAEPPATLHEAMRHSLFAGGKRLRPLLCVAAAEAVGGDGKAILPMACALEMIHTFSLIHDDLPALDNDDLRRGLPTSHVKFGEAMAILAGDALHTLAFATIATHQTGEPSAIITAIRLLADACGSPGMVGGQVDDLYYEGKPTDAGILKSIHARKTGALLNVSLLTGALLVGASVAQQSALTVYGEQVGLAFQIIDDILDVTGDEAKIGKPTGSDEKHDKATYPKLYGLAESRRLAFVAATNAVNALASFDERAEPLRAMARFVVEREL